MKRELRYNKDIVFHIYFLILSFHYKKIPPARRDFFAQYEQGIAVTGRGKNLSLSG